MAGKRLRLSAAQDVDCPDRGKCLLRVCCRGRDERPTANGETSLQRSKLLFTVYKYTAYPLPRNVSAKLNCINLKERRLRRPKKQSIVGGVLVHIVLCKLSDVYCLV